MCQAKAVDGFPASRWASDYVDNTWFQVDLGETQEFDTIRIDWEYARAKTYKLLVSDDKKTWTNIMPNDGVITAQDGKDTVQFSPVTARYIKFQGIERNTDYGYSFYEFGVYKLSGDVEVPAIDGLQAIVDAAARKVTIDGLLMNGDDQATVSLKVLDPQGKVHYEEQKISTAEGKLQFVFTLKGQLEGTYKAYVSTDGMVTPAKVSFEYKKADPGNGNGNNGNNGNGGNGGGSSVPTSPSTPVPVELKPQADGSVRAVVSTKLDSDGKTALGTVSEQDLQKAIAEAKPDADGKLNITLEMNGTSDAANYALDLPASFFSEHPNLLIKVITPKVSIVLSGQMFDKSTELGKQMRLIIGEGNRQLLSRSAQAQVGSRPLILLEVKMDGKSIAWKNEKAPVLVTIPYIRANSEAVLGIGILSISNQGTASIIPAASYSDVSKNIHFQTSYTGTYGVFFERSTVQFTDLGKYVWAQEAVEQLAALGIVKGTSATTFSPTEQVSRADFIVMLVRALDLKADVSSAFSDVQAQDYYYDAVSIAKQLGVVTGVDGDRFAPQGKITRQDMVVMAVRAIQAAKGQGISGNLASLEGFKDIDKVSDYAVESIAGMVELGLIQGDGGMLRPHSQTTRAEAVVFLYRLLNNLTTVQ
ncbi:S-layer homology domain-containing protein [Paenibacillus sp. D2_2]|uniref:S-layer homology domain-containing protein n=1 Tax=Paenibacillus sp. D2_2 TaxID=3073092 RepID=UPI002815DC50|nr:S-layer homology domain-containing protein [Paenibacillus sp. D2_2]WMT41249.1 S-layer homology domain-containing protein [Paenibacillus sp. D2_2]